MPVGGILWMHDLIQLRLHSWSNSKSMPNHLICLTEHHVIIWLDGLLAHNLQQLCTSRPADGCEDVTASDSIILARKEINCLLYDGVQCHVAAIDLLECHIQPPAGNNAIGKLFDAIARQVDRWDASLGLLLLLRGMDQTATRR
ncbi:hypothetical protein BC831DRAFT_444334 [Entophlyctis helioformis]|nr:hypothetical protein BC831DRAFT_444334 [Entophlyctis helioformis]